MRNIVIVLSMLALASVPARAAQGGLERWFNASTAMYSTPATSVAMTKPDYLPGTSRDDVCRAAKVRGVPLNPLYELQAYDPAHHLALANFFTDGCHVVLFSAVMPATSQTVRHADLSGYRTARGLRVGSSYDAVRRIYGGPRNASSRFSVRYQASTGKARSYGSGGMVDVPEQIIVLVENQRVKSIAVLIDLAVLT